MLSRATVRLLPYLLVMAVLLLLAPPTSATTPPNIILIVMDDAGLEQFDFYELRDPGGPYAETTFLSAKVDDLETTILTNAWSNPYCSPTRAGFHSGEHAFRNGIGDLVNDDDTYGLDVDSADLLPKLLKSTSGGTTEYATGLFGKWQMGTSTDQGNDNAPNEAGYRDFDALLLDAQSEPYTPTGSPYFEFTITSDGTLNPVETDFDADIGGPNEDLSIYATHEIIDRAIDWINDQEANGRTFFAYVPFFAPHTPFRCPRSGVGTPYPNDTFECTGQSPDGDEYFRSMIETIDIEIERLLDEVAGDPLVIITSDNGTPSERDADPFDSDLTKGTVGQGGVRVPLIVFGAGVQEGEELSHSVNINDLYATILDFAGKSSLIPSVDADSFMDLLTGDSTTRVRDYNYTETFFPNFDPTTNFGPCRGVQAVQEDPGLYATGTYKYVRSFGGSSEALYNLDSDPYESNNLISNPPVNRLSDLEYVIDTTLDSDLESICDSKLQTGESCTADSDCCSNVCSTATLKCVCPM